MGDAVDLYCERLGPGFWAEPVNALTNAAFLLAALLAFSQARRPGDGGAILLCVILAFIGAGSFLFHTLATRWTGLADVLPILAFVLVYLFLATVRFLGPPPWAGGLVVFAFLPAAAAISTGFRAAFGAANGSESYLPVLLAILLYAGLLARRAPATARGLALGSAILAASLVFRSLDAAMCPDWPLGTHFLWHLLNAGMLYTMICVLVAHGRAGDPVAGAPAEPQGGRVSR